jgi:hypothetical protein
MYTSVIHESSGRQKPTELTAVPLVLASVMSKLVASSIAYPHEVVRARLQVRLRVHCSHACGDLTRGLPPFYSRYRIIEAQGDPVHLPRFATSYDIPNALLQCWLRACVCVLVSCLCLAMQAQHEGFRALYCGFSMNLVGCFACHSGACHCVMRCCFCRQFRTVPACAITFVTYEYVYGIVMGHKPLVQRRITIEDDDGVGGDFGSATD